MESHPRCCRCARVRARTTGTSAGRRNHPRPHALSRRSQKEEGQRGRRPAWKTLVSGRPVPPAHAQAFDEKNHREQLARAAVTRLPKGEGGEAPAPGEGTGSVRHGHETRPSARRIAYELLVGEDATRRTGSCPGSSTTSPRTCAATPLAANSPSLSNSPGRPSRPTWRSSSPTRATRIRWICSPRRSARTAGK